MLVAAPGRFSTTTGWPRTSGSLDAIRRATMSVPPPGVNPTTSRIGRPGYGCASAAALQSAMTAATSRVHPVAAIRSFHLRAGLLDHLAPAGDFALQELAELLRRARERLDPHRREPVARLRCARDFGEIRVQPRHDVPRHAGRHEDAVPGVDLELGHA